MQNGLEGRKKNGIRTISLLLSLLFHILLIAVYFVLRPDFSSQIPLKTLTEQQKKPPYETMSFELIETPSRIAEAEPSEKKELVSDRNTRSSDLNDIQIKEGLPYSEGDIDVKNYPETVNNEIEETPEEDHKDTTKHEDKVNSFLTAFRRQKQKLEEEKKFQEPEFNNTESSTLDFGGFSFNTYNWEFAPYLLTMKRRIRNNMILPYAFTNLGAISGNIILRFEVLPDGVVNDMEIMDSNAHYSLEQSSVNAVRNSSAFEPLPDDFPEDKLVVTARFSFSIIKNK